MGDTDLAEKVEEHLNIHPRKCAWLGPERSIDKPNLAWDANSDRSGLFFTAVKCPCAVGNFGAFQV